MDHQRLLNSRVTRCSFAAIFLAAIVGVGSSWLPARVAHFLFNTLSAQVGVASGPFAITATAGTGTFGTAAPFGAGTHPASVAVGDVDGDGIADLVVANLDSASVSVLLGTGGGGFGTKVDFPTGAGPGSVVLRDLNADGKPDVIVANRNDATVSVLVNQTLTAGTAAFATKVDYIVGSSPFALALVDVSGDTKADVVVANLGSNTVSVLLGVGDGTFSAKTDFGTGGFPASVAVGDMDNDGKPDLAVANFNDGTVSVLLGTGGGSFGPKSDFPSGGSPVAVATADLDGDGKLDLAVTSYFGSTVSVLLGTAPGSFGSPVPFTTLSTPNSVAIGDLNGDGKPDLAVSNGGDTKVSVLLGVGGGSFAAKTDFVTGSGPNQVVLADVNADGVLDLVAANFGDATAAVLLGLGGSIAPPGVKLVNAGANQTYTITPQAGYAIANVLKDGISQGAAPSVTFSNVQATHTINAAFRAAVPQHLMVQQPAGTPVSNAGSRNFGSVQLGGSAPLTFTVKNTGDLDLTGVGVTIDGADAAMFQLTASPAGTVSGPNGSTTFTVTFTPTASGARTAALHVASNDSTANPFDVTLTGTATAPFLVVEQPTGSPLTSGDSRSYSTVNVGATAVLSFTIKNTGDAPLTGLGLTLDGTDAAMFSVTTSPVAPVAPGGTTTLGVQFAPTSAGARSAAVHITSNDTPRSPFNILLSGTGTVVPTPFIVVEQPTSTPMSSGGSRSFGSVIVGATGSLSFNIKNTGTANLTGLTVTIDGADAAMFSVTASPVAPLAPNANTTLTVQFAPTATGSRVAAAHITSNDTPRSPFDINLSGTGAPVPAPIIAVDDSVPSSVPQGGSRSFGTVTVGSTGSLTFTVKNTGTANLTGLGVTITGPDAAKFSVTTSPVPPVAPAGSTTLTVQFAPTAPGAHAAVVHIASNDTPRNPFDINLTGTGAAASAPVIVVQQPLGTALTSGASRSFNTVNVGSSKVMTFTVKNTGTANLTGLGVTLNGTDAAMFTVTVSPVAPVAPSGSTTLSIKFTPTANGARSATAHIASNDTAHNPFDIVLGGTGATAPATVAIRAVAGSGEFGAATSYPADDHPGTVAVADFNNDGILDVAVSNNKSDNISVFLGNGNGTFGAQTKFAGRPAPIEIAAGDLDGDGLPDLVVANNLDDSVSVWLNTGGGTFGPRLDYPAGSRPQSVAIADLNGDGFPDLAVADYNSASVSILPGLGNGTFGTGTALIVGVNPTGVVAADVNGDGKIDLVLTNSATNVVSVMLGTGGGNFPTRVEYATGAGPFKVAVGDLNGDGQPDLAVANSGAGSVSVLLNIGSGQFGPKTDYLTGTQPTAVAIGDLNGDGRPDLAVVNIFGNSVSLLFGTGTGTFGNKVDIPTAPEANQIVLADLNADGNTDLVIAGYLQGDLSIRLGLGGSIAPPGLTAVPLNGNQSYSVTTQPGYMVSSLRVDGVSQGAVSSYPFTNVTIPHTITAALARTLPHIAVEQPSGTALTSGASRDFSGVPVGSNASLTFVVRNTGGLDLTGLGITIDGADAAMFSVTTPPTAPVAGPTGSTTFTVRFTPSASGVRTANLHLASNDTTANPFNVVLNGIGTVPGSPYIVVEQPTGSAVASGGSRSFGVTDVGTNTSLTFTVKNVGTTNLTGLGVTLDGADAALFTVTTSPVAPVVPGGSTTLVVKFSPVTIGLRTAALHIASNDSAQNPFNITITGAGGGNAAGFVGTDVATHGTWNGVYGTQGFSLAGDGSSLPTYAQLTMTGQSTWTYSANTSDTRALQRPSSISRLAAVWYEWSTFSFDLRLNDGLSHQIALYLVDWDSLGRSERLDILDADTGALLNSRTVSSFSAGQFLLWNMSGHVTIRVTNTGPGNGVVSGLFIDPVSGTPNSSPAVSLTAPGTGASLTSGSAATVSANASDSDGTITSVAFFANGTPIGTDTTSPYSISWTPSSAGNYSLTAVATDNLSATTTSAAVSVTVTAPNVPPAVSLTAPGNGAVVTIGNSVTVSANASDSDGTVSQVQFFAGVTPIGSSSTSPYSISWTPAAPGSYSITAVATDNQTATTTSAAVSITVNNAPSVNMTAPGGGASFASGVAITVSANASDSDGTVSQVQFFAGATPIGTDTSSPYSISWTPGATGPYSLTAVATDNQGATKTSAAVSITITPNNLPTVSLTAPGNGATFASGVGITVSADANDTDGGVTSVAFFAGATPIGTDTSSPYSISWTPPASGSYSLTAVATDSSGATTTSAARSITVNTPPTVTLGPPAGGASVPFGVPITVGATANDSDGTVSQVQFFAGVTSIGTDTSSPYSISWTPSSTGPYSLTAVATDNQGATTTSTAVSITITANNLPTVNVTAPADASTVILGNAVTVSANASDAGGSVASVGFFANGTSIGTDTSSPYSISWTPVSSGNYSITAVATDNQGAPVTSAAIGITVNSAPSVNLTAPSSGLNSVSGTAITVSANASDADGTVSSVQFFAGVTSIGTDSTSPYSISWTPPATGPYSITAVATDNLGATTTSAPVSITVTSPVPNTATFVRTDAVTKGTWGGVFGTQGYSVAADATSLPSYAQVTMTGQGSWTWASSTTDTRALRHAVTTGRLAATYYAFSTFTFDVRLTDGLTHQIALYSVDWDSTGRTQRFDVLNADTNAALDSRTLASFSGGIYHVWNITGHVIIRLTNTGPGNAVVSALFVDPMSAPNVAPTVNLTAPGPGTVSSPVTVSANAADSDGSVASVAFFANGTPIGTDTTSPYSISWTPATPGNYSLTAQATDNVGTTTTSSAVSVTVSNNQPTVNMTAPSGGASFPLNGPPITVSANAADSDGSIASVAFFANGSPIGTDTSSPYSISWSPVSTGPYSLTATATDNLGATMTSTPAVSITITPPNVAPSVTLTAPNPGLSSPFGVAVTVSANASDSDGSVTSVAFFANGSPIGTDTSSPYSISWTPPAAGSYSLTAVATDNQSATTQSGAVSMTVPNTGPVVNLTAPGGGASFPSGVAITVTANASDADGSVSSVAFFANGTPIGTDSTSPYSITWMPSSATSYSLTATATDNLGAQTPSGPVSITVTPNNLPTVSLSAPLGGSSSVAGAAVTVSATASDSDGSVTSVAFFANGSPIGTDTSSPYSISWSPSSAGSYSLTAVATDNSGAQTTSTPAVSVSVTAPINSATFVKTDTTTKGTWKGTYGSQGYSIANDTTSLPSFTQVGLTGQGSWTWAGSTSDTRGVQKGAVSGRIAATWYSFSNFSFDVRMTDGASHQIAIYMVDWDSTGRTQRVDVLNPDTGVVLDTRTVTAFSGGQYLVWTVSGHVTIRVTNTGPGNGIVSSLFVD